MRVAVVGGSIGGLTTALVLRRAGFDVDVYERTAQVLEGRGAGIVLQPDTVRWLETASASTVADVSTSASRLRYLGPSGQVVHEQPASYRFTSWSTIYRPLLEDFGPDRYHLGEHFVGLDQSADDVELRFVSGRRATADLVVFADGISSTGRRRLLPDVGPSYSGYVGWRGTVPEAEVSDETLELLLDALSYAVTRDSHMNIYPIPGAGGELEPGRRRINHVWYRNVPQGSELDELLTDKRGQAAPVSLRPGTVQDRFVDELRAAAQEQLPPPAAELVAKTDEPFVQVVLDVVVPRMVVGRAVLVGDAAFAARPHAAAGTAKAAADAWSLGEALAAAAGDGSDLTAALADWERRQLALGSALVERVQAMGRRSQVEGTWVPGDPSLLFGLYGPGR